MPPALLDPVIRALADAVNEAEADLTTDEALAAALEEVAGLEVALVSRTAIGTAEV